MLTAWLFTVLRKNHPANKGAFTRTLCSGKDDVGNIIADILSRLSRNRLMVPKRKRREKAEEIERKREKESYSLPGRRLLESVMGHLS